MSETPSLIYHYTTQNGLLGIIRKRQLWASSILHLNDASEFGYAFEIAKLVMRESGEQSVDEKMRSVLGMINSLLTAYVASFSANSDQLGQWRAYCRDSGGYSIGFDADSLRKLGDDQDFTLEKCTYSAPEHEREIKSLIQELPPSTEYNASTDAAFLFRFMQIAPTMKHSSFEAEQEWRIVSRTFRYPQKSLEVEYREGKSFIVPYRTLRLESGAGETPIRRIVVGPTPHPRLSRRTVEECLRHSKFTNIEVVTSNVPYRSW
jgi:hypothetical protein